LLFIKRRLDEILLLINPPAPVSRQNSNPVTQRILTFFLGDKFYKEWYMKVHVNEIRQRINFIHRTLKQALRACQSDSSVPSDLKNVVRQLDQESNKAKQALQSEQEGPIRQSVDALARLSEDAQKSLSHPDDINYSVKSALILAHIELSGLISSSSNAGHPYKIEFTPLSRRRDDH
jgi:hypothetical protein